MKTLFNRADDVFHVFAQKTHKDAKNSSRNVFTGRSNYDLNYADIIYSYGHHYELARFIDDNTVLINDEGYSVTTSKHISGISYATRQYKQFYKTKTNLDLVLSRCKDLYNRWIKARKPEIYVNEINYLFESLNEYIKYTKKKCKRDKRYLEIKKIHKSVNTGDAKSLEAYRKNVKRREAKKLKNKITEAVKDFYNYKRDTIRLGNSFDYVRMSRDGKNVETTQGVKVSYRDAKVLYIMIKKGKDIKGHKIGYYTVTSINGSLKIGCHSIDIESMHRTGEQLLNL